MLICLNKAGMFEAEHIESKQASANILFNTMPGHMGHMNMRAVHLSYAVSVQGFHVLTSTVAKPLQMCCCIQHHCQRAAKQSNSLHWHYPDVGDKDMH